MYEKAPPLKVARCMHGVSLEDAWGDTIVSNTAKQKTAQARAETTPDRHMHHPPLTRDAHSLPQAYEGKAPGGQSGGAPPAGRVATRGEGEGEPRRPSKGRFEADDVRHRLDQLEASSRDLAAQLFWSHVAILGLLVLCVYIHSSQTRLRLDMLWDMHMYMSNRPIPHL